MCSVYCHKVHQDTFTENMESPWCIYAVLCLITFCKIVLVMLSCCLVQKERSKSYLGSLFFLICAFEDSILFPTKKISEVH